MSTVNLEQAVVEKLRALPPDKQQELLDFAEFLCNKVVQIDRHAFLKLPLEERRRLLVAQSEQMMGHYQQDPEWKEWTEAGIGNIDEYESPT